MKDEYEDEFFYLGIGVEIDLGIEHDVLSDEDLDNLVWWGIEDDSPETLLDIGYIHEFM